MMAGELKRAAGREEARVAPEAGADFSGPERRTHTRHEVDCPVTIAPLTGAGKISGRLVDLSMGGCRLETSVRVMVTIMMRVELQFQLRGIAFRLVGVCQGTRGGMFYAIRFQDISERKRVELLEVIAEVAHLNAQKAAAAAAKAEPKAAAAPEAERASAPVAVAPTPAVTPVAGLVLVPAAAAVVPADKAPEAPVAAAPAQDRRQHGRHSVDTSAKLLLVKAGISMPCRIVNLSLSGCRLRTVERFNVGIYVRVEAEFYLHGLPFRLGGVSQAIIDKHTIGLRFLDVSERKRSQLAELMAEIADDEVCKVAKGVEKPDAGAVVEPVEKAG